MDPRANIESKWDELVTALGVAEMLRLCSDDEGRRAAISQLSAVLKFLEQTDARCPTSPLRILLLALRDLESGAKPAMLAPKTMKNRPRDDRVWQRVKIVAATIMDQLHEYADLNRKDAAKEVERVFSQYGLSTFRGYERHRSFDAEVLAKDVPLENKRQFLLAQRLPILLIGIGASGPKAAKARQRHISEIEHRIPKKPAC